MSNKESNGVLSCLFDNVNQFRDMSEMANYLVISKYEKGIAQTLTFRKSERFWR